MIEIELIEQKHKMGCAVACLAMVTGKTYDAIADDFINDFDESGMAVKDAIDYLGDLGFSVILKEVRYYRSISFGKDELFKSFADSHIIAIRAKFDDLWHFVVMDGKGKFFCPSGLSKKQIKDSYAVSEIIGIYKD